MDLELKQIINSIKEQTNIDVFVFTLDYELFYSAEGVVPKKPSNENFEGIFSDEQTNKTFFKLTYKQNQLVFGIEGFGLSEQNYAKFITNLIGNYSDKELVLPKNDYLKAILLGQCSRAQISKFMQKYSIPNCKCYVVNVQCDSTRQKEVFEILQSYTIDSFDICTEIENGVLSYVKFMDNVYEGYDSVGEFASFLYRIIYEEGGGEVLLFVGGTVKSFNDIKNSFEQAEVTKNLAKSTGSQKNIGFYRDYLFNKFLGELPKSTILEYYKNFTEGFSADIFLDEELTKTAKIFLDNDLNASETAKKMFLHRNTLNYRLEKIKNETGLDIRKFTDAFSFKIMLMLYGIKE